MFNVQSALFLISRPLYRLKRTGNNLEIVCDLDVGSEKVTVAYDRGTTAVRSCKISTWAEFNTSWDSIATTLVKTIIESIDNLVREDRLLATSGASLLNSFSGLHNKQKETGIKKGVATLLASKAECISSLERLDIIIIACFAGVAQGRLPCNWLGVQNFARGPAS